MDFQPPYSPLDVLAPDRQAIIASLEEKLKSDPKSLVGNKGNRKYMKLDRETVAVNQEKIEEEAKAKNFMKSD